jgi:hypothetical protein
MALAHAETSHALTMSYEQILALATIEGDTPSA